MIDEVETKGERRDRKAREKREDEKRRGEEYEALTVESESSLLRCHKCPIWSLCPHQKRELSRDLQFAEERHRRAPYHSPPYQRVVDEFKEGLKVMEEVKEKCPLLQAVKDTKLTDIRCDE